MEMKIVTKVQGKIKKFNDLAGSATLNPIAFIMKIKV